MKKSNSDREMTESEISMRKFLKQLGVTSHQKIEQKLDELMTSGKLSPNEEIQIIGAAWTPFLQNQMVNPPKRRGRKLCSYLFKISLN